MSSSEAEKAVDKLLQERVIQRAKLEEQLKEFQIDMLKTKGDLRLKTAEFDYKQYELNNKQGELDKGIYEVLKRRDAEHQIETQALEAEHRDELERVKAEAQELRLLNTRLNQDLKDSGNRLSSALTSISKLAEGAGTRLCAVNNPEGSMPRTPSVRRSPSVSFDDDREQVQFDRPELRGNQEAKQNSVAEYSNKAKRPKKA
ncbi:hypothetical protein P171DRAFT_517516 [Karstenula rhodostoma CBS 690.94]|uniref:Uncharacterized protein n=1 Tax=Karstenula rhodostoma CBS 690.94 TaxID=1392251 RepID=A0A9P4PW69_9PLEO|nr:hypothetical protein P171DRAFT_517516 [Karstenula rhodostoma CBS 690.94]